MNPPPSSSLYSSTPLLLYLLSLCLSLWGTPSGKYLRSHPYVPVSVRVGSATRYGSGSVQACVDYVFRPRPADSLGSRLWQRVGF